MTIIENKKDKYYISNDSLYLEKKFSVMIFSTDPKRRYKIEKHSTRLRRVIFSGSGHNT